MIDLLKITPKLVGDLWLGVIQNYPGPIGFRLRYRFWKKRLKSLGKGTRIDIGVSFINPEFISLSDNCWVDRGVVILAGLDKSNRRKKFIRFSKSLPRGEVAIGCNVHIGLYSIISGIDCGILIGDDCTLSSGVKMYSFTHHYRFHDDPGNQLCSFGSMVAQSRQCLICGPIVLEDNVGVAFNAAILPGVHIGKNSFIKAGSLLYSQSFLENSLISGNPAIREGYRFHAYE